MDTDATIEDLGWFIKLDLGINVSSGAHAHHMFVQTAMFFLYYIQMLTYSVKYIGL